MSPLLLLSLLACTPENTGPAAPEPIPVRLALNWFPEPEFGGFYEGVLGGFYQRAGFQVEILPGGPGAPTLELLQSGQAQVAITSADDLLVKRARGLQAVAAWVGFQLTPVGLMSHPGQGLTRIEDLPAHPELRVAIEIGSPFQRWLWAARGFEGKVETVPTTGAVASFVADPKLVQQGYVTSEPCVARQQGVDVVFLRASDAGWNPYGTVLAVAEPAPPWTADFVAATHAAWESYLASPDRANAEILRQNDQLGPELMACITDAQRPFLLGQDGLGAMTDERWRQTLDALVTVGLLEQGTTAEGAWIRSDHAPSPASATP